MKKSNLKNAYKEKVCAKLKENLPVLESRFLSRSTNSVEWFDDLTEAIASFVLR
jgi:hypothetical protein